MIPDSQLYLPRIKRLSHALMISGVVNIGVLSLLIYWMMHERPPTPYCELKPATHEQQQAPLADLRNSTELLNGLSQLPFSQLVSCLRHSQVVENGYAERDLALACLITFHHFDIQRALPKELQPKQKRLFAWKPDSQKLPITLVVYPDLTQKQFNQLAEFATIERWPLTAEGLFILLQKQKGGGAFDPTLIETFFLTPEFWTVERLLNRPDTPLKKDEVLYLLLDAPWDLLKQLVVQQRKLHDQSTARRQKVLIDYLQAGAPAAAGLLIKTEWDFSLKKLEDHQVITILKLLPQESKEGFQFAKELVVSPRSTEVWQQAASWLYAQAGEPMPKEWNYQQVLHRFKLENKKTPEIVIKSALVNPVKSAGKVTPYPKPTYQLYVVQQGDSLWKIAKRFGSHVDTLKTYNQLESDTLQPGITLKIPSTNK